MAIQKSKNKTTQIFFTIWHLNEFGDAPILVDVLHGLLLLHIRNGHRVAWMDNCQLKSGKMYRKIDLKKLNTSLRDKKDSNLKKSEFMTKKEAYLYCGFCQRAAKAWKDGGGEIGEQVGSQHRKAARISIVNAYKNQRRLNKSK